MDFRFRDDFLVAVVVVVVVVVDGDEEDDGEVVVLDLESFSLCTLTLVLSALVLLSPTFSFLSRVVTVVPVPVLTLTLVGVEVAVVVPVKDSFVVWLTLVGLFLESNLGALGLFKEEGGMEVLIIRIKKGKSCDALEYHECLKHLAQTIESYASSSKSFSSSSQNNKDIALQKIQVIVESEFSCRRGMVTNEGDIRVGAGMSPQSILASISQLSERAYEKKRSEEEILTGKCHPLMEQIRAQFGIHPIYRVRVSTVTSDEMHQCLQRLLDRLYTFHNTTNNTTTSTDVFHENKQDGEESFHQRLLGHSLGITSKGQFCHLGDDGSIVVPCDFF